MTTPGDEREPAIVLLGRDSLSTRAIGAALERRFGRVVVVFEDAPGAWAQVRARVRRQGPWRAGGQFLFKALSPLLAWPQRRRQRELRAQFDLAPSADAPTHRVASANGRAARALLRRLAPDVVVVSGTRILSAPTLECAPVFVNLHAGVTPAYRGVHGGYWAMVENDAGNFGATVHRVDAGVDTGAVLRQVRVAPTAADGYFTYPLLQLQAGLPALLDAVADEIARLRVRSGAMPSPPVAGPPSPTGATTSAGTTSPAGAARPPPSRQWFHPTLWQYIRHGLAKGVW